MDAVITLRKSSYFGLFFVALSTLMYEILITRIFSVTMWYHFAFVAISIALFGMSVGAIIVYLHPNHFTPQKAKHYLSINSLLFSISIIVSFLAHLNIPFAPYKPVTNIYSIAITYIVIAIPFVFSGICVCLALTKFPQQVSKLYAADLTGAAFGCLLLIGALNITDGPTAVVLVACLAAIGTIFFSVDLNQTKRLYIAFICFLLLASFVVFNTILVKNRSSLLRLTWVKGRRDSPHLYEKWNSFSRIHIDGDPCKMEKPFGWGLSPLYPPNKKVRQLWMEIDATAGTPLTEFKGDLKEIEHLKYDITNLAHYIRPNAKVFVVGPGGGRDILSALVFNQKTVLAVEINKAIIDAVNKHFGDFTGHLDENSKVTFVNDEARSYITRIKDKFDIIQVSFIDTWAATTAGAFVLTENSLYTLDAWNIFLKHLTSNGILTFSRWYLRELPGEMYRLTALASVSLKEIGIENPNMNIIVLNNINENTEKSPIGVGTILVSKEPFSNKDLDTIESVAKRMKFGLIYSPRFCEDTTFAKIASGKDISQFVSEFPIDISPPTDNKPFFFHMLRIKNILNQNLYAQKNMDPNMKAILILGSLVIIVITLTFLCILIPLILTTKKNSLKGSFPLFVFFSSIGFGFMLIEISQMQRLIIFLGHPTYSLSVVLFSLLISSGIGSFSTRKINISKIRSSTILRFLLLICTLFIFGIITPYVINIFQEVLTLLRIFIAISILFPIGLFMGMSFPLGLKISSARFFSITPWFCGINGATSVCASVIAMVIALTSGISVSFWTGFWFYVIAFCAIIWSIQRKE